MRCPASAGRGGSRRSIRASTRTVARSSCARGWTTRAAGCGRDDILAGLRAFQPLHHRVEEVARIDGVTYYDDSKATNTGAVLAALGQVEGKVVLIAGGRDKGEDYALLQDGVREKARQVILIGEAADQIAAALAGIAPLDRAATMEEAVRKARAAARPSRAGGGGGRRPAAAPTQFALESTSVSIARGCRIAGDGFTSDFHSPFSFQLRFKFTISISISSYFWLWLRDST